MPENLTNDVLFFNDMRETEKITRSLKSDGFTLYWDYVDKAGDEWEYALHEGKKVKCGKMFLFAKMSAPKPRKEIPLPPPIQETAKEDPVIEIQDAGDESEDRVEKPSKKSKK